MRKSHNGSFFFFTMSKDDFVTVLKKMGYAASIQDRAVTVEVVGEDLKKTYISVKMIAKKVGYDHTIRVKKLEESNG